MSPSRLRDRFKTYVAGYGSDESLVSQVELALGHWSKMTLERKVHLAKKAGDIKGGDFSETLVDALEKGVLTEEEKRILQQMDALRMNVVNVDDFSEADKSLNKGYFMSYPWLAEYDKSVRPEINVTACFFS